MTEYHIIRITDAINFENVVSMLASKVQSFLNTIPEDKAEIEFGEFIISQIDESKFSGCQVVILRWK